MKKKLTIIGISIGVLLLLVIAAFLIFPGQMVKSTVNTAGPLALGVDVRLEDAVFRVFRGKAELTDLFIGNPEGFNTPSLCEVGKVRVKLDPGTLLSDTLIIDEIYIDSPVFTYQKSLTKSNLSALLKNLEGEKTSEEKKKEKEEEKEEKQKEKELRKAGKDSGKKVIIRDLRIEGAMVKLSIKGIPAGAPIPLPEIQLTDIGKESEGASATEIIGDVFGAVLGSITKVAAASINVVGKGGAAAVDGAKDAAAATADAAGDAAKAAGKGVLDAAKGLGGLIKKD